MTLQHNGQLELTVVGVSKRDAGVYTCVATNEVGRSESKALVTIVGEDENGIEEKVPQTSSGSSRRQDRYGYLYLRYLQALMGYFFKVFEGTHVLEEAVVDGGV